MHELSITENILEISLRHANAANAKRITDIYLVLGRLSSVVDDSIQFYWDTIARGTIAEGARLHFERIPAKMTCQACGHVFEPSDESFTCPQCASLKVKVTQGDELRVDSIDIE